MRAAVYRFPAASPSDASALDMAIAQGMIRPETIVAVLGKTEGNGGVNDFTRGFATASFRNCLARPPGVSAEEAEARVALVMSGGITRWEWSDHTPNTCQCFGISTRVV